MKKIKPWVVIIIIAVILFIISYISQQNDPDYIKALGPYGTNIVRHTNTFSHSMNTLAFILAVVGYISYRSDKKNK